MIQGVLWKPKMNSTRYTQKQYSTEIKSLPQKKKKKKKKKKVMYLS